MALQLVGGMIVMLHFSGVPSALAQELPGDAVTHSRAKVIEVVSETDRLVPGTDTTSKYQTILVEILEGAEAGKEIQVDNDYLNLKEGDVFYLMHTKSMLDGKEYYSVGEPYRLPFLLFFLALFVAVVLLFGGWQGARGLISLFASLFFIGFLLLPGIMEGYSPLLVAMGVSSLIVVLGSYVTHGCTRTTTTAVIGMLGTIGITGALAFIAVSYARLSGFESEEALYLHFGTNGSIDFVGLLLGGIMIGLLGVLYDAAIGQAVAVEELSDVGKHLAKREIFLKALRIGREHIGALVNTLAIAYVGASLPLFLLFYSSGADFWMTMNKEIFATEIIRILIGSIGVVLVVPITTAIAVYGLSKKYTP